MEVRGDGGSGVPAQWPPLRPIYDWVRSYEQSWSRRFGELDAVLGRTDGWDGGDGDG